MVVVAITITVLALHVENIHADPQVSGGMCKSSWFVPSRSLKRRRPNRNIFFHVLINWTAKCRESRKAFVRLPPTSMGKEFTIELICGD